MPFSALWQRWSDLKLGYKLPVLFGIVGILTAITSSTVSFLGARGAVAEDVREKLSVILEDRQSSFDT